MEPNTVSASSLASWEECPAKYKAQYVDRVPESGKKLAADTGTVCHYALEHFVNAVYLNKTATWSDKDLLDGFLKDGYRATFNSADYRSPQFKDAQALVDEWYKRTDLSGRKIISTEQKKQIQLPAKSGPILMTYIIDRLDVIEVPDGSVEFHVVDYKTSRINETFESVINKLQAQLYAMAVFLEYSKQYKISAVWVHLDMLRHQEIGVEIPVQDCREFYLWLLEQVDLIRGMDGDSAPEIIGPWCQWCPRKMACKTLDSAVSIGGFVPPDTPDEDLISNRVRLDSQIKALKSILETYDDVIKNRMTANDSPRISADGWIAEWGKGRSTRTVDPERASQILGPDLTSRISKVSVTELDKLIAGGVLTPEQESLINSIIGVETGSPTIKYKKAPKPRKATGR